MPATGEKVRYPVCSPVGKTLADLDKVVAKFWLE